MLHPPPLQLVVEKPQTRKRKRETAAAEGDDAALDKQDDPNAEETEDATKSSKQPSEQPTEAVPVPMSLDAGESEGEGQEVDAMLFSQSCNITEPSEHDEDHPARDRTAKDKVGVGSAIEKTCDVDFEDMVLQYPYPADEPMDVDVDVDMDVGAKGPSPAPAPVLPVPASEQEEPPDGHREESNLHPITIDDDADASGETLCKPAEAPVDLNEEGAEGEPGPIGHAGGDGTDAASVEKPASLPECYIYSFDSLGSRHAAVFKHLGFWLRHEAVDKKNYRFEDTAQALGKTAKAPMQDNFCDCGLFVLAFVDEFMRDPVRSAELIRVRPFVCPLDPSQHAQRGRSCGSPRAQANSPDWCSRLASNLRELHRTRTLELCEEWKKDRAAKEAAKEDGSGKDQGKGKEKEKEGQKEKEQESAKGKPAPEVIPDSEDDDIEISDILRPPPSTRGGKRAKANRIR
ncbi:hypothetical protein C8Q80DRAFT_424740 [Daedaleopsis nitida]|nr:hypothetical protein C8Q80DRAFT_424740 [Daedaleopsis nitida]